MMCTFMSTSNDVSYTQLVAQDGHKLRAFVAIPECPPRGAIVLLQPMDSRDPNPTGTRPRKEVPGALPGVNAFARSMATLFAREGFLVVTPSTFGRGRHGHDRGYVFERDGWELRLRRPLEPHSSEPQMLDIEAGLVHARRLAPEAKVGLVGYCWGALLAWRAAAKFSNVRAAVCHYGGGMERATERGSKPVMPVLTHWADDPKWTQTREIADFMAESAKDLDSRVTHIQHAARYNFMNPQARDYSEVVAESAHSASVDFLAKHLAEI